MTAHAPTSRRNAEEQRKLETALIDLFERRITFNQVLGLKVLGFGTQGPTLRFDMRPELVGHYLYGRLHGGVISATLDATAGLALMARLADKHPGESADQVMHRFLRVGTIDLRIDYLRQGIGKHFIATAEVLRLGGRVGSATMRLVNDQAELIASGAASYIIS